MAVKFTRQRYSEWAKGTHGGFDYTPWRRSLDPKQRLLVIYLGLGMFGALLFIVHSLGMTQPIRWEESAREGRAVVLKKGVHGEGTPQERYDLTVEVEVPEAGTEKQDPGGATGAVRLVDRPVVDKAGWDLVEEGTRIAVTYVTNERRSRVRVLAISVDAAIEPLGESAENAESGEGGETDPSAEPAVLPPEGQTSPGALPEPDTPLKDHPTAP